MKRAHVLAVTFLAGLICGCAVPAHANDDLKDALTASPEIKAEIEKSIDAAQCAAAISVATSPDSPMFMEAMDRETDLRFVALHHAEKAVKLAQEQHKYVDGFGLFSPYAFDLGIHYDYHGLAAYAVMGEFKNMVMMLEDETQARTFYRNKKCPQIFAENDQK